MGCSHSQAKEATGDAVLGGIEHAPDEAIHPSGTSNGTTANEQDPGTEPNAEHNDNYPDQTVQESSAAIDSANCSGGDDVQGMPFTTDNIDVAVLSRSSGNVDRSTAVSRSAATSIHQSRERNETTILSNGGISLDTCKVSVG
jgi:hypothetical protein